MSPEKLIIAALYIEELAAETSFTKFLTDFSPAINQVIDRNVATYKRLRASNPLLPEKSTKLYKAQYVFSYERVRELSRPFLLCHNGQLLLDRDGCPVVTTGWGLLEVEKESRTS